MPFCRPRSWRPCRRRISSRSSPTRQAVALRQALAQQALVEFQRPLRRHAEPDLRDRSAGDQKGILDLQARISAELGMLQNEQTKLQVLAQADRGA